MNIIHATLCVFLLASCLSSSIPEKQQNEVSQIKKNAEPQADKLVLLPSSISFSGPMTSSTHSLHAVAKSKSMLIMKWLKREGKWDIVENSSIELAHPASTLHALQNYRIQFKIPAGQFVPILKQNYTHTDKKGAETMIQAGIPIDKSGTQNFIGKQLTEQIQQYQLQDIPIPASYVSDHFLSSALKPPPSQNPRRYCLLDNALLKDDEECRPKQTKKMSKEQMHAIYDRIGTLLRLRRHGEQQYGLVKRQDWLYQEISIKMHSDFASPKRDNMKDLLGKLGKLDANQDVLLQKNTPIYWPDGSSAGVVRQDHYVDKRQLNTKQSLHCIDVLWDVYRNTGLGLALHPEHDKPLASFHICYKATKETQPP